jgi:CBS domain-containing protein
MGLSVQMLLSGNLYTTTPDTTINDAAKDMLDKGVGALPVIEDTHLVGLVTEFDLVKAFSKE